jgi:hypothetical protein
MKFMVILSIQHSSSPPFLSWLFNNAVGTETMLQKDGESDP